MKRAVAFAAIILAMFIWPPRVGRSEMGAESRAIVALHVLHFADVASLGGSPDARDLREQSDQTVQALLRHGYRVTTHTDAAGWTSTLVATPIGPMAARRRGFCLEDGHIFVTAPGRTVEVAAGRCLDKSNPLS